MKKMYLLNLLLFFIVLLSACSGEASSTETITVSLESNYETALSDTDITKGSTLSDSEIPTPNRNGYRFNGWYLDELLTEPLDYEESIDEDIKLYAYWTPTIETLSNALRNFFFENGSLFLPGSSYYSLDVDIIDDAIVPAGYRKPEFNYNYEDDYFSIFFYKESDDRVYGDFIAIEAYILPGDYQNLYYDVYGLSGIIQARTKSNPMFHRAELSNFIVERGQLKNFSYRDYMHYGDENVKEGFVDDTMESISHLIYLMNSFSISEFGFPLFPTNND